MKYLFILISVLYTSGIWAQHTPTDIARVKIQNEHSQEETPLKVYYSSERKPQAFPLYYINGERIGSIFLKTLNPKQIEKIDVIKKEKRDTLWINGKPHYGEVHITLKEDYQPTIIALKELVKKHLTIDESPILFTIDEELITEDYEDSMVDENYIQSIEAEKIEQPKENLDYWLIKITTRKPREIRVRGIEDEDHQEGPNRQPRRKITD